LHFSILSLHRPDKYLTAWLSFYHSWPCSKRNCTYCGVLQHPVGIIFFRRYENCTCNDCPSVICMMVVPSSLMWGLWTYDTVLGFVNWPPGGCISIEPCSGVDTLGYFWYTAHTATTFCYSCIIILNLFRSCNIHSRMYIFFCIIKLYF
jgi:hypothetical protein